MPPTEARHHVLLVNPNSSRATTGLMAAIAERHLPAGWTLASVTASRGPVMIVDEPALRDAASAADDAARSAHQNAHGIVVAAFGDPGLDRIRRWAGVPVIGIGEAALREAAAGGRRFGVATTTPRLVAAIARRVEALGLASRFTGTRVPDDDPLRLAGEPARQDAALAEAAARCLDEDGAERVVIGGGPLGRSAERLAAERPSLVVEPIPSAIRALVLVLAELDVGHAQPR